jgi:hypothetical protein
MSPYQQKAANALSSHEDILIESKRGHFHRVMTLLPVEASLGFVSPRLEPEFLRVKGVELMFGIKRGKLYALINEGKIKSKTLRSRGTVRGIRLIDIQSVREFINSSEG